MFSAAVAGDSSALILDASKQDLGAYQGDEDYTRKKKQMKATLSKSARTKVYL